MLNPFPDLLVYGHFAPTLIRVLVAMVFLYGAYAQFSRLRELSEMRFPIIGHGAWIVWVSIAAHVLVGLMFFAGYYTQIAALLGAVVGIKGIILAKRYARLFPLCRLDYAFILVMCLSLLLSGAGGFAYDLPL